MEGYRPWLANSNGRDFDESNMIHGLKIMIRPAVTFTCLALCGCAVTTAKLEESNTRAGYSGEVHDMVVFLIPDKMPSAFAEQLLSRIEYLIQQHHVNIQQFKVADTENKLDLLEHSPNFAFSLTINAAYTKQIKIMPGIEQLRSITLTVDLDDLQKNETEFTAVIDVMKGIGPSIGASEADNTAALLVSKLEEAHFLLPIMAPNDQH